MASINRGCAENAHDPDQGVRRIPPGHLSPYVFPRRNLSVQRDLQHVCFGVTSLERPGGMVVAPVVFTCLQQ